MVVVHSTIAMCLCECVFVCLRMRGSWSIGTNCRLTINFSYRRIRCGCVSVCVLVLYKLLNRTLGASTATAINEKRNGTERSMIIIMVFFFSVAASQWHYDSVAGRCRTPLSASMQTVAGSRSCDFPNEKNCEKRVRPIDTCG